MSADAIYSSVADEKLEELREEVPVRDVELRRIEVKT
ncbi:MAG: hypothetical protein ACI9LV_000571 [Candidatus Nanohaloarchaea archaeon]|jgi:hypothetical protein